VEGEAADNGVGEKDRTMGWSGVGLGRMGGGEG